MARTERLLELLVRLQARPRFTVRELADEFAVSRRTMLRDLRALSALGVPLAATPGPHGGYRLIWRHRLPPLALTTDEALGLVLSYEAFLTYAQSPFATQSLSAITKLRGALPPDVLKELDRVRRHVAVVERPRSYEAPLLSEILAAALDETHLRVIYASRSGISARVIFPFGLYASAGFWYCACHDERRGMTISLRADRFVSLERVAGLARPPRVELAGWLATRERDDGMGLPLRLAVSAGGMKRFELETLFARVAPDGHGGGLVEGRIPEREVEWYAAQLLPLGEEVMVESPSQLVAALLRQARAVLARYDG